MAASLKLSELTALTAVDDADLLLVTDSSATQSKKVTFANLKSSLTSGLSVDDLRTAVGTTLGTGHVGTFTGSTIADNGSVKTALQALETAVEGRSTLASANVFQGEHTLRDKLHIDPGDGGLRLQLNRNTSSSQFDILLGDVPSGARLNINTVNAQQDDALVIYSSKFWCRALGNASGNAEFDGNVQVDGTLTVGSTNVTTTLTALQADIDQNESDADTALALKAPLASPAFTGDATFAGNVDVAGNFQIDNDGGYYLHFDRNTSTQLDIGTGNIPSGGNLNIKNSNGNNAQVVVYSDLFWVRGLGGTSGNGNVKFDGTLDFDDVTLSAIQTSGESFADNDTSLMTSAAINDRISAAGGVAANNGTHTGTTVMAAIDLSGDIDVDGTANLDAVDIDGDVDLAGDLTFSAAKDIQLVDNNAAALEIAEAGNNYVVFDTTDNAERVEIKKDVTLESERLYFTDTAPLVRLPDNKAAALTIENHDGSAGEFVVFTTSNSGLALTTKQAHQHNNTFTVGEDDTGYDVKLFGATASAYLLWDESADDLILAGAAGLVVPDGQFTLGSTAVTSTAAELNLVDGITAGTVTASKAVIVDSNKDLTGLRNLTITGDLTVQGTQTVVDTVTMQAANAIVFEGATADDHETTLTIIDPDGDRTVKIPNQSGCLPVLAADSSTAITATPEELNVLDGVTAGTVAAGLAVVVDSNKDAASFRNVTLTGELDAATLDISGDADIDGTTNLDAVDIDGATQIDGTVTVGVDDTGYDVKFFGATASAFMLWDESADDLILSGAAGLVVPEGKLTLGSTAVTSTAAELNVLDGVTAGTVAASKAVVVDSNKDAASFRNVTLTGELDAATLDISGDADIDGTTNLDAVDIDGAVQADGTVTVGVDDTGYDVKFFGATSGAYMLWDESEDDLVLAGAAGLDIAGNIDVDGTTNLDAVDIDGDVDLAGDLTFSAVKDIKIVDNDAAALEIKQGGNAYLTFGTTNSAELITIHKLLAFNAAAITVANQATSITLKDNTAAALDILEGSNSYLKFDTTNGSELITATKAVNFAGALQIGGTAVTSTAAELNLVDGITAGTVSASLAVIVDSNKDVTGFRNVTATGEVDCATLDVSSTSAFADNVTIENQKEIRFAEGSGNGSNYSGFRAPAALTANVTFTLPDGDGSNGQVITTNGSGTLAWSDAPTPSEFSGVTAGTVSASKGVEVDSNKDITGFRNVTLTGELDTATLDVSGDADIDGTTNLDAVDIDGATQIDATVTVGVDDTGYDVKFFGATSGAYMLWDESEDDLILGGGADLKVDGVLTLTGSTPDIDLSANAADILLKDNDGVALRIRQGANEYQRFCSADNGEYIEFFENLRLASTVDSILLQNTTSTTLKLVDNLANSFVIAEDSNVYLTFTTTNSGEKITAAKTLDVTGGLSISGTAVTSTAAELNILDGVTSTAAELNILDGVTSTTAELNILDGVTADASDLNLIDGITAGTVIASKAIITDSNKDITGGRNITITGELDAATLDISGDADIDGTTNLDAVDIDGATQIDATVTVGVDDTGYDVKFFGATSGASLLWDESEDDLILAGAARVVVPDGQLVLNSTAVTSTAAELNLLDGATDTTWTATLEGSTGNPGSKVTATGQYARMGKMVIATVHFNSVDTTSYAGDISISGLPVTSKNTATAMFMGNVYNSGMISGATDSVQALVADNGTTISFLENANNSALAWGTVGAGKSMRVQVVYISA
jgi:cytoskeletal protein CcmA (bactofilin family)